jgi:hypothetical protein
MWFRLRETFCPGRALESESAEILAHKPYGSL